MATEIVLLNPTKHAKNVIYPVTHPQGIELGKASQEELRYLMSIGDFSKKLVEREVLDTQNAQPKNKNKIEKLANEKPATEKQD